MTNQPAPEGLTPETVAPESVTPEPVTPEPVAAEPAPAPEPPASEPPAAAPRKTRARRGPPPEGEVEERVTVILTTSRLSSTDGQALRRGRAVSIPARRLSRLLQGGKVREATAAELQRAERLGPVVELA